MNVRLYNDVGADAFCVKCLADAMRDCGHGVETIDAAGILAGDWQKNCDVLAFPGGADRPYMDKLNGRGNDLIRDYVEGGGAYLGVCAGAYYACRRIDFTGVDLRVQADRELDFFPGTAVGSLTELAASYEIGNLNCAAAVKVNGASSLYWGGCVFAGDEGGDFEPLARFDDLAGASNVAAVRVRVGNGVAVLTGMHAEVSSDAFDQERQAYAGAESSHVVGVVETLRAGEEHRRGLFAQMVAALERTGNRDSTSRSSADPTATR